MFLREGRLGLVHPEMVGPFAAGPHVLFDQVNRLATAGQPRMKALAPPGWLRAHIF
jgi:hypothetical protein